jgi:hypothetical protein
MHCPSKNGIHTYILVAIHIIFSGFVQVSQCSDQLREYRVSAEEKSD